MSGWLSEQREGRVMTGYDRGWQRMAEDDRGWQRSAVTLTSRVGGRNRQDPSHFGTVLRERRVGGNG